LPKQQVFIPPIQFALNLTITFTSSKNMHCFQYKEQTTEELKA